MGVNLGEAVNFAAPDWLRFGAAALGRLRHFRKPCVVSQEEMLLRVAAQQVGEAAAAALALAPSGADALQQASSPAAASPLVCFYLAKELRRVAEEEWVLRAKLWSEGGQQRGVAAGAPLSGGTLVPSLPPAACGLLLVRTPPPASGVRFITHTLVLACPCCSMVRFARAAPRKRRPAALAAR
jgi:hypothetical protein